MAQMKLVITQNKKCKKQCLIYTLKYIYIFHKNVINNINEKRRRRLLLGNKSPIVRESKRGSRKSSIDPNGAHALHVVCVINVSCIYHILPSQRVQDLGCSGLGGGIIASNEGGRLDTIGGIGEGEVKVTNGI